jgi:hypothetical protein
MLFVGARNPGTEREGWPKQATEQHTYMHDDETVSLRSSELTVGRSGAYAPLSIARMGCSGAGDYRV